MEPDEAAMQRHGLAGYADEAARDAAVADQPRGNERRSVDADGEADPLRLGDDGSVDADDFAARVDERTAGVAGIQRGIGLDDVVDQASTARAHRTPEGA